MRLPSRAWLEWSLCGRDFRNFLPYWHFVNRESGQVVTYRDPGDPCPSGNPKCKCLGAGLWPGQADLADVYMRHRWVFALKAGKLGFTELECAYDAWALLLGHANTRVHLFSKDDGASKSLLSWVKFGVARLPVSWEIEFQSRTAGGTTAKSLIVRAKWMDADDIRTVVSYPSTGNVAIDQSAQHTHCDELSHMQDAEALWSSIVTTVVPGGTLHVVTRGAGDAQYSAELWEAATETPEEFRGTAPHLFPFFAPYDRRPDRDEAWRAEQAAAGTLSPLALSYYLPQSPEEALAGDEDSPYIPLERWDTLLHGLPPLERGGRESVVIGLDAGVKSDCFGAVVVTRHPDPARYEREVAIRGCRVWRPQDFPNHRIELAQIERWVRWQCQGGCRAEHPRSMPLPGCEFCDAQQWDVLALNVVQVCYDPHELEEMSQSLIRDGVVWASEFNQNDERLIGDGLMYRMALQGTLTHDGNPVLREHIGNAKAKVPTDEESKMRMIKKRPSGKIDAAVAAAMAVKRCKDLNL